MRRPKGFVARWKWKIRHYRGICKRVVKTSFFYWLVIGLVFLNTVFTAVEHYGQPGESRAERRYPTVRCALQTG